MRSIVCCICKNENKYLEEFVEYHLSLGFDQIIIGDNNDVDGEHCSDVLNDYVEEDEVIIFDLRGQLGVQKEFYNYVMKNVDYDWCAFIDCDEFITFGKDSQYDNINEFLASRDNVKAYALNWMVYGDNGRVYAGEGDVQDRFKIPMPLDFKFHYFFPENHHVKSILNKTVQVPFIKDPHHVKYNGYYSPSGNKIPTGPFNKNAEHNVLYIRHFYTKSLEEWVNKKMKNKYADNLPVKNKVYYPITDYFIYNKITDAKIKYLKQHGIEPPKKL